MPRTFKVYLAGPISGLAYDVAQDWRAYFSSMMPEGIVCYSPLRGKAFLRSHGVIHAKPIRGHLLATDRGIMTRDHHDVRTCDVLMVNLQDAPKASLGTAMEIAWAHAYGIPVVAILDEQHDHPMIREAVGYRVSTLTEAAGVIEALLLP